MKKRNLLLCLLLLLPMWIGCTEEDYRNCPAGLWIAFEPINPKHDYPGQVQGVSLYFYDPETGALAEEFRYTREQLRPSDRAAFVTQIPTGTYRVVAVVNSGIYTQTKDAENYSTLHSLLDAEEMNYKPADFYSAEKTITVRVNTSTVVPTEVMDLTKHNNNVHLNLVYDGYEAPEDTTLDAWIEGNNAHYAYATRTASSSHFARYTPWDTQTDIETGMPTRFSFTTMRLWRGSDVTLVLQETSTSPVRATGERYEYNLTDDILSKILDEEDPTNDYRYDTDEELEFHDEYEIYIKLLGESVGDPTNQVQIAVGLNRWDSLGGGVEL